MKSQAIVLASLRWFQSKKPIHWSQDEHLKQATVNCRGEIEHALAEAVAEALREKQEQA